MLELIGACVLVLIVGSNNWGWSEVSHGHSVNLSRSLPLCACVCARACVFIGRLHHEGYQQSVKGCSVRVELHELSFYREASVKTISMQETGFALD